MSSSVSSHDQSSRQALSPLVEVPVSFGSSPMTTSIGSPGEEAGHDRLREELRDPAEPEGGEDQEERPGDERDRRDELCCVVAGDPGREHGPAGDGRQRRAGPGRDLPRGAEQGIDQSPGRGGVEPVLDRDAGDPGIAEILRDDQRRDGDAGRQVSPQEAAVVPRQPVEDREEP